MAMCHRGFFVDGRTTVSISLGLAPRVDRGLPWSLPRPFCLSPGFSFPVDPYRTGEFRLAVSVASHGVVGGGATHTMPGFVLSKGVFCFDKILWASYLAVHAHELSVLLHYAHSGLTGKKFSPSCFSFYAYGSKKKRNCVRQARARSISHTSTHIRARACVTGRRAVRKPRWRV